MRSLPQYAIRATRLREEPVAEDPKAVEAAFVFAWEWSIGGKSSVEPDLIESVVFRIRKTIPLDRAGAQSVLRRQDPQEYMRAALVLAYEGIGASRAEPDYAFSLEDLDDLARARYRSRVSFWRAVGILRDLRDANDG